MEKMTFKTFVWPQNPHSYKESLTRELVYYKDEDDSYYFAGLGPVKRVITGSGVFVGETAYDDFRRLQALFEKPAAGDLQHPIWGIRVCYLTELELTQEPKTDWVSYRFTFTGADADGIVPV